jgi:hypothetical protein
MARDLRRAIALELASAKPRALFPGTQKLGRFQLPMTSVRHPKGGQRFRTGPRHRCGCGPSLVTSTQYHLPAGPNQTRGVTTKEQPHALPNWRSEAQIRLSRSSQQRLVEWSTPTRLKLPTPPMDQEGTRMLTAARSSLAPFPRAPRDLSRLSSKASASAGFATSGSSSSGPADSSETAASSSRTQAWPAKFLALLAAGAYLVREGYRRNGRRQIP